MAPRLSSNGCTLPHEVQKIRVRFEKIERMFLQETHLRHALRLGKQEVKVQPSSLDQ